MVTTWSSPSIRRCHVTIPRGPPCCCCFFFGRLVGYGVLKGRCRHTSWLILHCSYTGQFSLKALPEISEFHLKLGLKAVEKYWFSGFCGPYETFIQWSWVEVKPWGRYVPFHQQKHKTTGGCIGHGRTFWSHFCHWHSLLNLSPTWNATSESCL